MKQTAVEWLYDEIKHIIPNYFLNKFEQAKEMEKQQLNNAYNADRPNLTCYEENTAFTEYYNETFKSE